MQILVSFCFKKKRIFIKFLTIIIENVILQISFVFAYISKIFTPLAIILRKRQMFLQGIVRNIKNKK